MKAVEISKILCLTALNAAVCKNSIFIGRIGAAISVP